MRPITPQLVALCLGATSSLCLSSTASALTAKHARTVLPGSAAAPVSVFNPLLPQLAGAHIPVYLPSWLPSFPVRVYPVGGVTNHGNGYFAYLSTRKTGWADANLVFTLDAGAGPPDTTGRAVALGGGLVGHIDPHTGGNREPTLSWRVGRYSYEIGYLNTESKLIRAARSMVRVRIPTLRPADPVTAVKLLNPFDAAARHSPCYPNRAPYHGFAAPGCPVTGRLKRRLQANPTSGPGGGADPICRCQNTPQRATTYHLDSNTGKLAHVTARFYFTPPVDMTFVVVRQRRGWRVDDVYCAGRPGMSIYQSPVQPC